MLMMPAAGLLFLVCDVSAVPAHLPPNRDRRWDESARVGRDVEPGAVAAHVVMIGRRPVESSRETESGPCTATQPGWSERHRGYCVPGVLVIKPRQIGSSYSVPAFFRYQSVT